MRELKVGVIGMGFFGELHARTYQKYPLTRLVGIADIDRRRVDEFSDEFGVDGYEDYHRLLDRNDIDLVSICTPDQLHLNPVLAAVEAEKHILLEKPLATTCEDADQIVEAVAGRREKFMVGHILRFAPKYETIKEYVAGGQIGEPVSIFARRTNVLTNALRLKGRVSILHFLGVHDFDIMRWIVGSEVESVYCTSSAKVMEMKGIQGEDATFTTLRFADGTIGCAEHSWLLPEGHPSGHDFQLNLTGSEGTVHLDDSHHGLSLHTADTSCAPSFGNALEREIGHFAECIIEDLQPRVSLDDAYAAMELALKAGESAAAGHPVEITGRQ